MYKFTTIPRAYRDAYWAYRNSNNEEFVEITALLKEKDPLKLIAWKTHTLNPDFGCKIQKFRDRLELVFGADHDYPDNELVRILNYKRADDVPHIINDDTILNTSQLWALAYCIKGRENMWSQDCLDEMAERKSEKERKAEALIVRDRELQEAEYVRLETLRNEGRAFLLSQEGIDVDLVNKLIELGQVDVGDMDTLILYVDRLKIQKYELGFNDWTLGDLADMNAIENAVNEASNDDERKEIIRAWLWENLDRYPERDGELEAAANLKWGNTLNFTFGVRRGHSMTIGRGPRRGERVPRRGSVVIRIKEVEQELN